MKLLENQINTATYKLIGHSGCELELINTDGRIFVSKISSSIEYNSRLKKQCKKQKKFISQYNVSVPKIYQCGYKNDLFYFNMEYINGKSLAEYTENISISEISNLIQCLFNSLYFKNIKHDNKANKIFLKKISHLKTNLCNTPLLQEAFLILENFNWSNVYKSPCHGDLTLENIIVTNEKKLFLIDFLDSFYNSWQIDIAKLLQDLELKWSFRNIVISSNRALRIDVAKDALINEILKLHNGKECLFTIYHILLLNVIRIYPYTKDMNTLLYLDNAIENIINKIKTKGIF